MADCPCCAFNQQTRGPVFSFLSMIALLFTSEGGVGIKRMQMQLRDICIATNN